MDSSGKNALVTTGLPVFKPGGVRFFKELPITVYRILPLNLTGAVGQWLSKAKNLWGQPNFDSGLLMIGTFHAFFRLLFYNEVINFSGQN
jgi:hypothetical protein